MLCFKKRVNITIHYTKVHKALECKVGLLDVVEVTIGKVYEPHIESSHTQSMWVHVLPQLAVKKLKQKP